MRDGWRSDLKACLVLAWVILILGLPWGWASPHFLRLRELYQMDHSLVRVEVRGDRELEGIYEVRPGATVEGLLRTLGLGRMKQEGRGPGAGNRPLEDLSALILLEGSRWRLGCISPGKAFLLGEPLDLNRAETWDLTLLPGVGPVTARKIVVNRKARGPFGAPKDLARVPGIPNATLSKIIPLVKASRLPLRGMAPIE